MFPLSSLLLFGYGLGVVGLFALGASGRGPRGLFFTLGVLAVVLPVALLFALFYILSHADLHMG